MIKCSRPTVRQGRGAIKVGAKDYGKRLEEAECVERGRKTGS